VKELEQIQVEDTWIINRRTFILVQNHTKSHNQLQAKTETQVFNF
jgi:hypothetical protein